EPPGPRLAPRGDRRSGRTSISDEAPARRVESVPVPNLKGRMLEVLAERDPRATGEDALQFDHLGQGGREPLVTRLSTPDERAAVALACVILEKLRRRGGSRVPEQPRADVLAQLLPTLTARDMMQLEVEAYEMLEWIGRTLNPALARRSDATEPDAPRIEYDPDQAHTTLVARAIAEGFDLRMNYYTGSRGELTTRRITPQRIEAEKYLYAFCHTRQDTRVFRLSRIARLQPVGGVPVTVLRETEVAKPPDAKPKGPTPQKSLFDDD